MTTMTMNHVSDKALVERLEVFEENQRLVDQNAALAQKLKAREVEHVAELSRVMHQADDPVQTAIDILQSHQQYQDKLNQAERNLELFSSENDALRGYQEEATKTISTLRDQVTHYKTECEALLAKHNKEVQKAQAAIDVQARQLGGISAELKDLRALNPQRQAKQIKELQKKNKDLTEGNQQLRKLANDNQKIRKEWEERGRVITKLHTDNRRLDAALVEACDQMNHNDRIPPIEEHGDWAIYGHNDGTEALILLHIPTDTSRVYWAGAGFKKLPALPGKIKDRVEAMILNYRTTQATMIDYAAGERVEVA